MKNISKIILCVLLIVPLFGCSQKEKKEINLKLSEDKTYFDISVTDFQTLFTSKFVNYLGTEDTFKEKDGKYVLNLNKGLMIKLTSNSEKNKINEIEFGYYDFDEVDKDGEYDTGAMTRMFMIELGDDANGDEIVDKLLKEFNSEIKDNVSHGAAVSRHIMYELYSEVTKAGKHTTYSVIKPSQYGTQEQYENSKKDEPKNEISEQNKAEIPENSFNLNELIAEPNSSARVDEIAKLAKSKGKYIIKSQLDEAILFIKRNKGDFFKDNTTMEKAMYYGYLIENQALSVEYQLLGTKTIQAVKYVYRGIDDENSESVQNCLRKINKELSKYNLD